MVITGLNPREKLQLSYELAFYPPRLSEFWMLIKKGELTDKTAIADLIQSSLLLHRALPETGFSSTRALRRLAHNQACSKSFVPETFLKNIAKKLGLTIEIKVDRVPGSMIRDIGLPPFAHSTHGFITQNI